MHHTVQACQKSSKLAVNWELGTKHLRKFARAPVNLDRNLMHLLMCNPLSALGHCEFRAHHPLPIGAVRLIRKKLVALHKLKAKRGQTPQEIPADLRRLRVVIVSASVVPRRLWRLQPHRFLANTTYAPASQIRRVAAEIKATQTKYGTRHRTRWFKVRLPVVSDPTKAERRCACL